MVEGASLFSTALLPQGLNTESIEATMNSKVYQDILQENVRTAVHDFEL